MNASVRRDQIQRHIVGPTPLTLVEAEKALIGAVLGDPSLLDAVDGLTPDHLSEPLHGRLWGAILAQQASTGLVDQMLLDGQFASDPSYQAAGGLGWLSDLIELRGQGSRVETYVAEIRAAAGRRALLHLARGIAERAADTEGGLLSELLAEVERGAGEIGHASEIADAWLAPASMIEGAVERAQAAKGVIEFPLGIPEVDRLLGGCNRKEVTILAARPRVGKTVGAQALAKTWARAGYAVPFFSLEMGEDPMALRLACDLAYDRDRPSYLGETSNITLSRIRRNEMSAEEWHRVEVAQRETARWPLRFDTRPGHTMARIEALARRFYAKMERAGHKRGPLIIDHGGKVRPSKDRNGSLRVETVDISRDASDMAKRLDVPVILLWQLSRAVEGRDLHQPKLSDLREAGQLEEDARQVVFLHRPELYLSEPTDGETFEAKVERETKLGDARHKLFWIVAKNSNGPEGSALTFCEIAASAVREWR
jgi:replicative DNA helicase